MARFNTIDDLGDLADKRVLVRADLNVPMRDGQVADDTRIQALVPTVKALRAKGAKVVLMSHFGRPKGQVVPDMSLRPLMAPLSEALGEAVGFCDGCGGAMAEQAVERMDGVLLLENLRFDPGEEANDADFARSLAALGDLYINDAFSAAHRAHASTEAIAHELPSAAGVSMAGELAALEAALGDPKRPVVAVVGGAKVSTKLAVLDHLVAKVDHLVIGGGMANTFLAAKGVDVGRSLAEHDLADTARAILDRAGQAGCAVHLPSDAVVATEFKAHAEHRVVPVTRVGADEMILDVGPASVEDLKAVLAQARTVVWNGPLGAFETPPFDAATVALAREAARLTEAGELKTVAGGGDTVAALAQAGVRDGFSHVSTAGGAFLEWMEGRELPGVKALAG